uniref:Uncharacterized protein n=1 Tax=Glossina brevipalpis TaxID=37001 RepID=A0A1A9W6Q2_9MUSC
MKTQLNDLTLPGGSGISTYLLSIIIAAIKKTYFIGSTFQFDGHMMSAGLLEYCLNSFAHFEIIIALKLLPLICVCMYVVGVAGIVKLEPAAISYNKNNFQEEKTVSMLQKDVVGQFYAALLRSHTSEVVRSILSQLGFFQVIVIILFDFYSL